MPRGQKRNEVKHFATKSDLAVQLQRLTRKYEKLLAETTATVAPELDESTLPEVPAEGLPFRPSPAGKQSLNLLPQPTAKPTIKGGIVIHPTPYVRSLFSKQRRGLGGFQSLHAALQERMAGSKEMVLSEVDFARIIHYAVNYGEGGFQQSLRWLVALWAAENVAPQLSMKR